MGESSVCQNELAEITVSVGGIEKSSKPHEPCVWRISAPGTNRNQHYIYRNKRNQILSVNRIIFVLMDGMYENSFSLIHYFGYI